MRKQVWIFCVVILVVCLLLILFRPAQHQNVIMPEPSVTPTNPPSQTAEVKSVEHQQATNIQKVLTLPPNATPLAKAIAGTNPLVARELALWQAPIEFYGKVVDEDSNAVVGAQVSFHWMEKPTTDGSRSSNTESDSEGLFSLHGAFGPTLTVSVSKAGYYTSKSTPDGFRYALGNEPFYPDLRNPVVFHLLKKGSGVSLIAVKRNCGIPRDGTPVSINLKTGATATGENGDMVIQCWTHDAGKRSGEKYDWRCVVSFPGGGAVTNNEEFAFEAPENGYAPSLEIAMPADRPDWQDAVDLKFYYRLADGSYGRMTFSMVAFGHHFCMIDSVLNPTGSRNLEPSN